ncbi:hypothetical protein PUNSTDRAFT_55998 [Punctularia strigosozonata HHB-11173 SS5]|uniref:Uncharacterized protein n=1 Tax=Punctularia strigosozonata (strain HHB-11173) TaxID=741275 RepID=R7S059_PUNST|nr:uncharacterized protein PUNSTDRAFT_55998 [Punctularia strigosozonata HHB-11173 SS5]EIN03735.1 hypothetical protein PUNSTDRAFT_55998 [Punctularia strigosozonata HHB-11173 SS5]
MAPRGRDGGSGAPSASGHIPRTGKKARRKGKGPRGPGPTDHAGVQNASHTHGHRHSTVAKV